MVPVSEASDHLKISSSYIYVEDRASVLRKCAVVAGGLFAVDTAFQARFLTFRLGMSQLRLEPGLLCSRGNVERKIFPGVWSYVFAEHGRRVDGT